MNYLRLSLGLVSMLFLTAGGCGDPENDNPNQGGNEPGEVLATYVNPVFRPVLADPSVLEHEGIFYAYGTEDNWGNEGGHKLVPIVKSKDLVNWELAGTAFPSKPTWKDQGGLWAPDVVKVGNQFFMYYSYSTWGDPNPGIGLAIANKPEGPFIDQGKFFLSQEIGVANSIDAFYMEDDEKKYLFWGSFHGIYAVELADDGKSVKGEKVHIGYNHLEASYVHKKDGKYYYFGSEGSCCDGANSSYRVRVAVSDNILGPYLDKAGNDIKLGNFGEVILSGNSENYGFAGPGHNGHIMTDDAGDDWILYHAIPKGNPLLQNGASRRPLMLDKLIWKDGWPTIERGVPSLSSKPAPKFN
ncbi:family 43 glycosylhydrolase [Belliella kenyensis]|uniref:Family 43 glycosylhydrolase n=1 Tax=Belliella kenyensis TaxID=1472724 RepID=A0ABV8ELL1_9BACT|nr:family 43 glycosylhydrolase [Belliella kenyensis]MCH7403036.1 family 43 glycosylhydrolase [Belliella kenyensis]